MGTLNLAESTQQPESLYRSRIQAVYSVIEKALEQVDPDLAEVQVSQGSLSIQFSDQSKCILSAQPSVRQLWVAVASLGKAHHFNFVEAEGEHGRGSWRDDKAQEIELYRFLEDFINKQTKLSIQLKP